MINTIKYVLFLGLVSTVQASMEKTEEEEQRKKQLEHSTSMIIESLKNQQESLKESNKIMKDMLGLGSSDVQPCDDNSLKESKKKLKEIGLRSNQLDSNHKSNNSSDKYVERSIKDEDEEKELILEGSETLGNNSGQHLVHENVSSSKFPQGTIQDIKRMVEEESDQEEEEGNCQPELENLYKEPNKEEDKPQDTSDTLKRYRDLIEECWRVISEKEEEHEQNKNDQNLSEECIKTSKECLQVISEKEEELKKYKYELEEAFEMHKNDQKKFEEYKEYKSNELNKDNNDVKWRGLSEYFSIKSKVNEQYREALSSSSIYNNGDNFFGKNYSLDNLEIVVQPQNEDNNKDEEGEDVKEYRKKLEESIETLKKSTEYLETIKEFVQKNKKSIENIEKKVHNGYIQEVKNRDICKEKLIQSNQSNQDRCKCINAIELSVKECKEYMHSLHLGKWSLVNSIKEQDEFAIHQESNKGYIGTISTYHNVIRELKKELEHPQDNMEQSIETFKKSIKSYKECQEIIRKIEEQKKHGINTETLKKSKKDLIKTIKINEACQGAVTKLKEALKKYPKDNNIGKNIKCLNESIQNIKEFVQKIEKYDKMQINNRKKLVKEIKRRELAYDMNMQYTYVPVLQLEDNQHSKEILQGIKNRKEQFIHNNKECLQLIEKSKSFFWECKESFEVLKNEQTDILKKFRYEEALDKQYKQSIEIYWQVVEKDGEDLKENIQRQKQFEAFQQSNEESIEATEISLEIIRNVKDELQKVQNKCENKMEQSIENSKKVIENSEQYIKDTKKKLDTLETRKNNIEQWIQNNIKEPIEYEMSPPLDGNHESNNSSDEDVESTFEDEDDDKGEVLQDKQTLGNNLDNNDVDDTLIQEEPTNIQILEEEEGDEELRRQQEAFEAGCKENVILFQKIEDAVRNSNLALQASAKAREEKTIDMNNTKEIQEETSNTNNTNEIQEETSNTNNTNNTSSREVNWWIAGGVTSLVALGIGIKVKYFAPSKEEPKKKSETNQYK